MNKKLYVAIVFTALISFSCSNKQEKSSDSPILDSVAVSDYDEQTMSKELSTSSNFNYDNSKIKKVDSKRENRSDGDFNQMTLFQVDKNITSEQLKEYCSSIKANYRDGYFQILVFFKEPNAARFPDNPLTGMYIEGEDLKNIKADYTINNINGYSKLDYYENNSWESPAQTFEIY
ncbi:MULTISPECIES: hypothetical protein [unclassified Chryseobacterium]|uniref:hypothetical protein n=1 Tax=unclassified Chryseobacterium TaxID=2593645 RepID=UPI00226ACAB7|nr:MULTISPECIES: hypothetical protein [unclassified Chryseobacterium]